MEVITSATKEVQVLEMVSEEEEEEMGEESEHEEGEISSEEEGERVSCHVFSYNNSLTSCNPQHFPERRPTKTSSSLMTSEVIYDDNGRTAIFTSPKVSRLSSYPRPGEGLRQRGRERSRKKKKELERSKKHHSSAKEPLEKWSKVSRKGTVEGKGAKGPDEGLNHSYKAKDSRGVPPRVHRGRHTSPESTSGSSSCSSSSSSITVNLSEEESDAHSSPTPHKGKGKENRRCGPASKGHDRSPPLEYGCERPPPPKTTSSRAPLHRSTSKHSSSQYRPQSPTPHKRHRRPSYHHNTHKSSRDKELGKTTSHHRAHQKLNKPKSSEKPIVKPIKPEKLPKETEIISSTAKKLPRGSIGEMLLRRPKVPPQNQSSIQICSAATLPKVEEPSQAKTEVSKLLSETAEPSSLDQEDDEELQLRLIAIQSSLRLLTDMQREGQQELSVATDGSSLTTEGREDGVKETGEANAFSKLTQPLDDAGAQNDFIDLSKDTHPHAKKELDLDREMLDFKKTLDNELLADVSGQYSDDVISISSNSVSEICVESLATNKSYMETTRENVRERRVSEDLKRKLKERPDSDQNPVDMEICDTSGEEEVEEGNESFTQERGRTGEPASMPHQSDSSAAVVVNDTPLNSNNFQIPVEWAYMVPPPPPPDQPANDLHNINIWCFDQNMYLQSMQNPPGATSEEYRPCIESDVNNSEWSQSQPSHSQWGDTYADGYDTTTLPNTHSGFSSVPGQEEVPQPGTSQPRNMISPPQKCMLPSDEDLKDSLAEQYQAFMSAVLQQQEQQQNLTAKSGSFTECSQRNLILVPLNGNHLSHDGDGSQHSMKKTKTISKTKKMKAKQKYRMKKKLLKQVRVNHSIRQVGPVPLNTEASQAVGTSMEDEDEEEEEDEDLLRAQLLIDMSRKKQQRILESHLSQHSAAATTTTTITTTTTATTTTFTTIANTRVPHPAGVSKLGALGRDGFEGSMSPQSAESLHMPRIHRAAALKSFGARPRSSEGSPTHVFKMDMRHGLSDIGGWGLDPKGSKFNYHGTHDLLMHSDAPKIKFPPIKPVIISLKSDSEDDDDEDGKERIPSQDSKKEEKSEVPDSEPMIQSIDILLKSMRNANAVAPEEPESLSPKPGPSNATPTACRRDVADSTPQAVRHLSRHQQEEYRWLKEQLRKKEMQQRKKQLQKRPIRTKPPQPPPPMSLSHTPQSPPSTDRGPVSPSFTEDSSQSLSPSKEVVLEGEGVSASSNRAVTWKDMGLLQIQVSNEAALDGPSEGEDTGHNGREMQHFRVTKGDSSVDVSTTEDEDEETLRMMALLTQKKKKTEMEVREVHQRRVIMEEESRVEDSQDSTIDDSKSEEHQVDAFRGEWMVLDAVEEDGVEATEAELCVALEIEGCEEEREVEGRREADESVSSLKSTVDVEGSVCSSPRGSVDEPESRKDNTVPKDSVCNLSVDGRVTAAQKLNKTVINEKILSKALTDVKKPNSAQSENHKLTKTLLKEQAVGNGGIDSCNTRLKEKNVKPGIRHKAEATCNGKNIKKVVRRIENEEQITGGTDTPGIAPIPLESSTCSSFTLLRCAKSSPASPDTSHIQSSMTRSQLDQGPLAKNMSQMDPEPPAKIRSQLDQELHTKTKSHPCQELPVMTGDKIKADQKPEDPTHSKVELQSESPENHSAVIKSSSENQKEMQTIYQCTGKNTAATQPLVRKLKVLKSEVGQGSSGEESSAQKTKKSGKIQLQQLKKLEKEYRDKRNSINKMIAQLGPLLQEVHEEQQQRQILKKSAGELRAKLKEMEAQLETKNSAVQKKMELIRHLQQQLGSERQLVATLENKGERLGKQVYGSDYSLPKALASSPHSKSKDMHMKKALANSIHALRQQMRDLTYKRNSSLQSSGSVNAVGTEKNAVRTLNSESKKELGPVQEKVLSSVVSSSSALVIDDSKVVSQAVNQQVAVPTDSSNENLNRGSSVPTQSNASPVKRKVVLPSGPTEAKIAKVQVPRENSARQERGPGELLSGPNRVYLSDAGSEDKLDEMKALCPHDLLGRCNDDSCKYQHLPSSRPQITSHPPATATRGSMEGVRHFVTTTSTTTTTTTTTTQKPPEIGVGRRAGLGAKVSMAVPVSDTTVTGAKLKAKTNANLRIETPDLQKETDLMELKTEPQTQVDTIKISTETEGKPQTQTEAQEPQREASSIALLKETEKSEPETKTDTIEPQTEKEAQEPQTETQKPQTEKEAQEAQTETETQEPQIERNTKEPQTEKDTTEPEVDAQEPQMENDTTELQTQTDEQETQTDTTKPQTPAGTQDSNTGLTRTHRAVDNIDKKTEDKELPLSSAPTHSTHPPIGQLEKTTSCSSKLGTETQEASRRQSDMPEAVLEGDEESPSGQRKGKRATRKSLRVQAKASPKTGSSLNSPANPSPKKGRKRRTTTVQVVATSPSNKRRYPTRP